MPVELARVVVAVVLFYLGAGLVFALPFALFGAGRIDPAARGATWGFRLLIVPGAAALWPLLLWRLAVRRLPPGERNAHRLASREARP